MDELDTFAKAAMQSLVGVAARGGNLNYEQAAKEAYAMAKAMIAERRRINGELAKGKP